MGTRCASASIFPEEDRPRTTGPAANRTFASPSVTDGQTWERNLVRAGSREHSSLWVSDAGRRSQGKYRGAAGASDLPAVFLSEPDPEGLRQINAMLPLGAQPGDYQVAVNFAGRISSAAMVSICARLIQIVAAHGLDDSLEGHLATLGMLKLFGEIRGGNSIEKCQVPSPRG